MEERMKRLLPVLVLAAAGCAPGLYTRAEVVYGEPPQYEYVVPVDRVVVVTREVLVNRGYEVFRVEGDGPTRIIWARRGDNEVVRIFVNRDGERVLVRGLTEVSDRGDGEGDRGDREAHGDRGKHKGWRRRDRAEDLVREVDGRLRRESH
jgi:hypothetical protein